MPAQPFTSANRRQLQAALLDAYPTLQALTRLVAVELDENLERLAPIQGNTLDHIVDEFVNAYCTDSGRIQRLLAAARKGNPQHAGLAALAEAWQGIAFNLTPPCPYPGMTAFNSQDNARFFGREEETEAIIQRLRLHPLLVVIGPSGSGKSSLLQAGVVPRLQASTLFGQDPWRIHTLRPGDPLPPRRQAGPGKDLLLIDQYEELFTLLAPDEARAYQAELAGRVSRPNQWILPAVRADFYGKLMGAPLWAEMEPHLFNLPPLSRENLVAAIVKPAAAVGVTIAPELTERLAADAADEPGALPFLQETLVLLWEKVKGKRLSLQAYTELTRGNAQGNAIQLAMAQRGEQLYNNLSPQQQVAARRIFLRLIQFSDEGRPTRRPAPRAALSSLQDQPATTDSTLARLIQGRLLVAYGQKAQEQVELAHEALIQGWPRLADWQKEYATAELARRRLENKRQEWVRLGQGEGGLLDRMELKDAQAWLASPDADAVGVTAELERFIQTSGQFVNPGFHLAGSLLLGLASLSVVGLALLAFMGLRVTGLPWPQKWALSALPILVLSAAALYGLLRLRADPYLPQRWSYHVAGSRIRRGAILFTAAGALALTGWFQVNTMAAVSQCNAVGFQIGMPGIRNMGVSAPGLDPLGVSLFTQTINTETAGQVIARADFPPRCNRLLEYLVTLTRVQRAGSDEVAYTAVIDGLSAGVVAAPVINVVAVEACSNFRFLGLKVIQTLSYPTPRLRDDVSLPAPKGCAAWLANQEGYAAAQQKNYAEAIRQYEHALALSADEGADYALARQNLGLALLEAGRLEEAREELARAVTLTEKRYEPALINYARACYRLGDWACAAETNLTLIASTTDREALAEAYNNLAVVYRSQGLYADAFAALQEGDAYVDASNDSNAYALAKNRGITLYLSGDKAKARTILEEARQLGSRYEEEIVYYLTQIALAEGDEPACSLLDAYLSLPPGNLFQEEERRADMRARWRSEGCNP